MSNRYAPLPNPRSLPDSERELDEAFESDDELDQDHTESTPLVSSRPPASSHTPRSLSLAIPSPAPYDFERDFDYDRPPPGSPPGPSTVAIPNDIGNSNGLLPSSPVRQSIGRPPIFRRMFGALLPQYYSSLPTEAIASSRAVGGGTDNDGVFANVTAKPGRAVEVRDTNGDVHFVPEETQKDAPPTYLEAQADAVPQYWETTVHAPINLDPNADMIVDDLPTGHLTFFIINMLVSYFFSFVGFLLTYLLHTSHAAKYGSRAGLGLTLIQYGFISRGRASEDQQTSEGLQGTLYWNTTANPMVTPSAQPVPDLPYQNGTAPDALSVEGYDLTGRDWMAFLFMTLGWFLLLSSIVGYYRVKRWEHSIRTTTATPPSSDDHLHHDEIRRNIERAFFIPYDEPDENLERRGDDDEPETPMNEAEARLAADLRAAGLI